MWLNKTTQGSHAVVSAGEAMTGPVGEAGGGWQEKLRKEIMVKCWLRVGGSRDLLSC